MDRETAPAAIPADIREEYEQLLLGSVDVLPEGMLLRQLVQARAERPAAAGQAGRGPHGPRHPSRPHRGAAQAALSSRTSATRPSSSSGTTPARWAILRAARSPRPQLSDEVLEANARTYVDQAAKVLDMDKVELTRNGDWLGPLAHGRGAQAHVHRHGGAHARAGRLLPRYLANEPISMLEFMYPLLQGYDSVAVRADVELGGTDQKFNLLMGRTIMEAYGLPPQSILTVPLLVGTDGEQKMSKSYGNYIGVNDAPERHVRQGDVHPRRAHGHLHEPGDRGVRPRGGGAAERAWPTASYHPAQAKRDLAERVVRLYHSVGGRRRRRGPDFDRVFKEKDRPEDIPETELPADAVRTARYGCLGCSPRLGLAASNGEARRLIEQGGVRVDDTVLQRSRRGARSCRSGGRGAPGGQAQVPARSSRPSRGAQAASLVAKRRPAAAWLTSADDYRRTSKVLQ